MQIKHKTNGLALDRPNKHVLQNIIELLKWIKPDRDTGPQEQQLYCFPPTISIKVHFLIAASTQVNHSKSHLQLESYNRTMMTKLLIAVVFSAILTGTITRGCEFM
jgi:hypothetical protein